MKTYWKVLAPAALAAVVFSTGWWIDAHRVRTERAVGATPPANEKVFLETELHKKPGHSPVLLRLAQIERESGNLAEARKHLEQAVSGDQKLVDARLELSLVYYQMNDVKAALEQNRTIIHSDPKQPDALYNLGAIAANQGEIEAARKYWRDAVSAAPESPSGKKAAGALLELMRQK